MERKPLLSPQQKRIAREVRLLRIQRGVASFAEAARLASVSEDTWTILEVYGIPPRSADTRERIAKFLQVCPHQLFGRGVFEGEGKAGIGALTGGDDDA